MDAGRNGMPRELWDRAPWNRWSFQHVREIVPTVNVWRGPGPVTPFKRDHREIDDIGFEVDGSRSTIGSYLQTNYVDGLLVIHRNRIVAEHYLNGMTERTLHLSQSVAKSIVGTVAGILIGRGEVSASKPLTHYLPELESTAYRGATVQHVLDMTSGVAFDEDYTASHSQMAMLDVASGWKERKDPSWPENVWELILSLREAEREHGKAFSYRSIETDVLAFILQRASGVSLAELVSRELWAPMGAEEDACFTVDSTGYALADGGFNATLRDYGRFALLHLGGGVIGGRRIVPLNWIEATCIGDAEVYGRASDVLPDGAYRHQFWIENVAHTAYMARGVFGQLVYIDPQAEFAAVKLASWPDFLSVERSRTDLAAVHAIREMLLREN